MFKRDHLILAVLSTKTGTCWNILKHRQLKFVAIWQSSLFQYHLTDPCYNGPSCRKTVRSAGPRHLSDRRQFVNITRLETDILGSWKTICKFVCQFDILNERQVFIKYKRAVIMWQMQTKCLNSFATWKKKLKVSKFHSQHVYQHLSSPNIINTK